MSWMIHDGTEFLRDGGFPCTRAAGPAADLVTINEDMNRLCVPYNVNEGDLADLLGRMDAWALCVDLPELWLLIARLAEMALLCAGHYADNAEFQCAGDLLFNPRETLVFIKGAKGPVLKNRHGRLSAQFGYADPAPGAFANWFRHSAEVKTVRRPLMAELLDRMRRCGRFSDCYLDSVQARMRQVSDTIVFLSSWGLHSFEDLQDRLQLLQPGDRAWIESNLCRFDRVCFDLLGTGIGKIAGRRNLHVRAV